MNEQISLTDYDTAQIGQEPMHFHAFKVAAHGTPDVHQETFRVDDVAQLLGISADMIRHAVQSGALVADRVGHEIVCIHRTDLLDWLNTQGPGV